MDTIVEGQRSDRDAASVSQGSPQGPILPRFVSRLLHGAAAIDLGAVAAFVYRSALRGTNYGWANLDIHAAEWDERTRLIAGFVPALSWVLEFGCGRRVLETLLPGGCVYIPSDIVSRGPDTWVCDLNRRPLGKVPRNVDVAVFSGVLEYVFDLPAVLRWLSVSNVTTIVASYSCVRPAGLSRVFDTMHRLRFGWVTSYSEEELLAAFDAAGYELDRREYWRDQFVGRFVNARPCERS
jgi:hypothetical protein